MCGNKESTDAIPPSPARRLPRTPASASTPSARTSYETTISSSARTPFYPSSSNKNSSTASTSSHTSSLASLRDSLPENPHIYSFHEIAAATNNFLAPRISASSAAWRCSVRDKDVVVIQRRLHRPLPTSELRRRLAILCKSHHAALAKLLGAALSGDYIYIVYEFVKGANLFECLRNPRNPEYTVLGTWLSRMQIAEDVAHGLEYMHHSTGLDLVLVHNHIKSSTIILTDPDLRAKICHFGMAELTGEIADEPVGEIEEEGALRRSASRTTKVEGTRGYMAPEIIAGGNASQKSDVYAVGVVLLELLSGAEALKYRFDKRTGDYERVSQIAMAAEAAEAEDDGKLRRWIDRRLRDSYPTDVAKKLTRLALECVHVEADKRPDMSRVKGKISRHYLESKAWSDKVKIPTEFTVSVAGR
ncbi:lysM domain receptor-like kinase 3 [Aristolochia californica]|uniref:lysM domain receptor-like kinase 3 n=1 Tax=Aristolochia californica TaxID=171875 RepID=UPI0035DB90B3